VEAGQDEASPTTLPGESPEAKNLLLGEGQNHFKSKISNFLFECLVKVQPTGDLAAST
jgi:hypothetical protein